MGGDWVLSLALGESKASFNLEKAVCNHGFFMMAPNRWNPSTKTLRRPLRLADAASLANVSISHSPFYPHLLYVRLLQHHPSLSYSDRQAILDQVSRMVRTRERDEMDVREFHKVHPQAKEMGFGRIFRSPSLFEDIVKSILLCNCSWSRTLQMAEALCKLQFEIANNTNTSRRKCLKRKLANNAPNNEAKIADDPTSQILIGDFPTPKEIARLDKNYFLTRLQPVLGYRATYILELAMGIESGKVGLQELEDAAEKALPYEKVQKEIMKIKGIGAFASANVLMCLRYYQNIPADSETKRHLKQVHKRECCNKNSLQQQIGEVFDKYAPFQCLAYWMELLEYYEHKFGKLSELPASRYHAISGARL